ncbi:MAG: ComEC/Rec2 family competence protein [Actinomycetaceae bacterium]|nr:ComEC/Rec2 family competence protein [Actinomycetaceae bacterium]
MSAQGLARTRQREAPEFVDLRLVPLAVLAWAQTWVLSGNGALLAFITASGGAVISLVLTVLVVLAVRGRKGLGLAKHALYPYGSVLAAAVVLSLGVTLIAVSAGVHLYVRSQDPVTRLVTSAGEGPTRHVTLTGVLAKEPKDVKDSWGSAQPRSRVSLKVREVTWRGETWASKAVVTVIGSGWKDAALGQNVRLRAKLLPADAGEKDAALAIALGKPELLDQAGGVLATVNKARKGLLDLCQGLTSDARGLVPGITVGDESQITPELDAAMKTSSLTHLTAVSGAHVAIVVGTAAALLAFAPVAVQVAVTGLVLAGFVALVRPEDSVVRAALTGTVALAGVVAGRESRPLSALSVVVIGVLMINPWQSRSYGLALSVVATAGIVTLGRSWIEAWSRRVPRGVAALVAIPASAQVACAPILLGLNPALPIYGVVANVLAAPAVPVATLGGLGAVLLQDVWSGAAHLCAQVAGGCAQWIAWVARGTSTMPGASLPWPEGAVGVGLLVMIEAAIIVAVARYNRRQRHIVRPAAIS